VGNGSTLPADLTGVAAISVASGWIMVLKSDGTLAVFGPDSGAQTVPASLANVVAISAGSAHFLALQGDGTVVTWGGNYYGQSTTPGGLNNVIAVAAGNNHSLALKSDGMIVAWGGNEYGQTALPTGANPALAIAAGAFSSFAVIPARTPVVTSPPVGQTVSSGTSVTLSVVATGTAPLAYFWRKDGIVLAGASQSTLTINNVQASDSGSYTVDVTNVAGSVTSSVAAVVVSGPPVAPVIRSQFQSVATMKGQLVTLALSATGSAPLGYQWYEGFTGDTSRPIAGAASDTLTVPPQDTAKTLLDSGFECDWYFI